MELNFEHCVPVLGKGFHFSHDVHQFKIKGKIFWGYEMVSFRRIWLSCLFDGMLKGNVLNNEVTEYESLAKLMALL